MEGGKKNVRKTVTIDIPEGMTLEDLGYEEDDGSMGEPDEIANVIINITK